MKMKKTNEQLFEECELSDRTFGGNFNDAGDCIASPREMYKDGFLACAEIKDKEIEELKETVVKYGEIIQADRLQEASCGIKIEGLEIKLDETVKLLRESIEMSEKLSRGLLIFPASAVEDWKNKNKEQLAKILGGEK